MTREQALKKIRACLRLAQSANPNERDTALRQAQALMRRYGVEQHEASGVESEKVKTAYTGTRSKPPMWLTYLAKCCADAFGAGLYIQQVFDHRSPSCCRWVVVFYGQVHRQKVASYAYQVLVRQLSRDWNEFRRSRRWRSRKLAESRKYSFCEQWVLQVHEALRPIRLEPEDTAALVDYAAGRDLEVVERSDAPKRDMAAAVGGAQAGRKARVHNGVAGEARRQLRADS